MNIIKILKIKSKTLAEHFAAICFFLNKRQNPHSLFFAEIASRYQSRNHIYIYMQHYFHRFCPASIQRHRLYFSQEQRGFGEKPFHAMWWLLLWQFKPKKCLEIGVYRGQVISLWALIAKIQNFSCEVHGISPFTPLGDSVSKYPCSIDYLKDVQASFNYFKLPPPILIKALSTETVARDHVSITKWDLIYIDGSHDYEIALSDYNLCKSHLAPNGILVMDDSSLETSFVPPLGAFAGHPGPSRVVREFAMKEMTFLGAVGHNSIFQSKALSHNHSPRNT